MDAKTKFITHGVQEGVSGHILIHITKSFACVRDVTRQRSAPDMLVPSVMLTHDVTNYEQYRNED